MYELPLSNYRTLKSAEFRQHSLLLRHNVHVFLLSQTKLGHFIAVNITIWTFNDEFSLVHFMLYFGLVLTGVNVEVFKCVPVIVINTWSTTTDGLAAVDLGRNRLMSIC